MKRVALGVILGLGIGIATTAVASRSAGGPCARVSGKCVVMPVKGNGGTVFIPALDLECQTVSGDRRTSPFFGCSRASVQPFHTCVHGRTGSAAVFIDKQKMWFSGPFYCKIDHGQITGTTKQAPTSAYWYRSP